jgi:hypothetical protein
VPPLDLLAQLSDSIAWALSEPYRRSYNAILMRAKSRSIPARLEYGVIGAPPVGVPFCTSKSFQESSPGAL